MKWRFGAQRCDRPSSEHETQFHRAEFDYTEVTVLSVARYFWQTFAVPETQSWLSALGLAEQRCRQGHGRELGLEILTTVQAMRYARVSCFEFSNPACRHCAMVVTGHERCFMSVFRAVRDGQLDLARTFAMILCEGNDTTQFMERMGVLVTLAYPQKQAAPHATIPAENG